MSGIKNHGPSIRGAAQGLIRAHEATVNASSADQNAALDREAEAWTALDQALAQPEVSRADILDRAEWAIEGIAHMKAGKPVLPIHIQAIVTAAEAGLQAHRSFGVRWDADMRAIERWRSGAPSRDIVKLIETAGAVVATDRKALDELGGMAIQIEPETRALTDRLGAALEDVLSYSIEAAVPEARQMMLPDHADLVVWLMTLLDHQPSPAVYGFAMDEIGGITRALRYAEPRSIDNAIELIDKMAAGLIAADRRRFVAEQLAMPEDFPDLVAEVLGAELADSYDCSRTWDAWSAGTMTEDDFEPLSDRVQEIVLALMERLAPASRLPVEGSPASGRIRARDQVEELATDHLEALALLREAGELFREYETHHRGKARQPGQAGKIVHDQTIEKAERNAEIAGRIERFIAPPELASDDAASITEHPDAAGLEKRINDELVAICARYEGQTIGIDIKSEVERIAPGWKFAVQSRIGKPPTVRLTSFEPGEGAAA